MSPWLLAYAGPRPGARTSGCRRPRRRRSVPGHEFFLTNHLSVALALIEDAQGEGRAAGRPAPADAGVTSPGSGQDDYSALKMGSIDDM